MATLELNNARNNAAYILLNVNETGWNSYTTKAPSGGTTKIAIVDQNGDKPDPFTSLEIRFLSSDKPTGSGKGDIDAQASGGANAATVVLGNSGGSPNYDCCLALEMDNSYVSIVFDYIDSTG
jgi:hypothetical protein